MRKLTIRKKGYKRKGYTRKDGTKVKPAIIPPTTYQIKDVGAAGRGPKKIIIKERGILRKFGYSIKKPARTRRKALSLAVKKYGPARIWRRLHAQVQLREKAGIPGAHPRIEVKWAWDIFRRDRNWIKKTYHPNLTPRKAIKKWQRMSHKQRVKARR